MFGFNHPRPFSRKEVVQQMAAAKDAPSPLTQLLSQYRPMLVPALFDAPVAAGASDAAIRFSVAYRLPEYLSFLREHAASVLQAQGRGGQRRGQATTGLGLLVALIGAPIFAVKKWRMPVCDFSIDDVGIRRSTRRGEFSVAWRDVVAMKTCSQGYLLVLEQGAMPIPSRCLNAGQAARLRTLVKTHRDQVAAS